MSNFEIRVTKKEGIVEVLIPANLLVGYDLEQKQRLIQFCTDLAYEKAGLTTPKE